MTPADARSLGVVGLIVIVASVFALAVSQGGARLGAWPVFGLCTALIIGVQWIAFVPAYLRQTEHFFDLTGSATYIAAVMAALIAVGTTIVVFMVLVEFVTGGHSGYAGLALVPPFLLSLVGVGLIIGGWQHDSQQPDRNMRSNPRRYHWVAHWMLVALHQNIANVNPMIRRRRGGARRMSAP